MLEKNHNKNSKQFMQKILTYIDVVFVNAADANKEDITKTLVSGLINVRDAIFSEIVKDNQISNFNEYLQQEKNKKKEEKVTINQEKELEKDR